ncbi:hypothetical protein [Geobacter sp. OR-1]|uniref:hypothetical protein n=1 Tax=Geobacter sp. OR-1 TaxID=1266765 RepID=UPI0005A7F73A|nr:hypothetical protein [Geobacter sp. OR-1]
MTGNECNDTSTFSWRCAKRWEAPLCVLLFIVIVAILQLYLPYPLEDDTAYHYSVSRLIRDYGVLDSFPWTPFSLQAKSYADKEFLFHLLFLPFIGLGLVDASRVVGVICGTLILTAIYLVARFEKVRYAVLWALLPMGASAFVYRFAMVRPHLLSIALAIVFLWAYLRGRMRILFAVSLLYPLSYVAFWQLPLLLLFAAETARLVSGGKIDFRAILAVLGGVTAGVVVHPNTVNLLAINWLHMSEILFQGAWRGRENISLGAEFNPYPIDGWLQYLLLAVIMAGAAAFIAWKARKRDPAALAFSVAALFFCLLTVKSGRFTEYFVPFSVVALALSSRELHIRYLAPWLCALSLLYTLLFGSYPYEVMGYLPGRSSYFEPDTVKEYQQKIPAGARVFTCGWEYTGVLMADLPDRYFMVAADPTLFYMKDPVLYDLWYRLPLEAPRDAAEIIRSRFNCRYVICRNDSQYANFFDTLYSTPNAAVTVSGKWVMFDLGKGAE